MITDVQLAVFANVLGVTLFLLVVLYHYIAANYTKSSGFLSALYIIMHLLKGDRYFSQ
ncbi:hypothetical protein J437_LFUL010578 [Ladona fulva]|uniref:Dolichyl-diphosphooligosaccharide--protein glycosyltransferase subunit 4 n=1 Tax=Ladona fulva TaxID=123851 RepID=A0A8K0K949_LADFU|nr:hypothetical protein J437_LFUL010578 [Ladona fulva]